MHGFLILASLGCVAVTLGQNISTALDESETLLQSIRLSSSYNLSSPSNETDTFQGQRIIFSSSGYNYVGQLSDGPRNVPSLSNLIHDKFIKAMRRVPRSASCAIYPMHITDIKSSFTFPTNTQPWTCGDFLDALIPLRDYFIEHPSEKPLRMTIASAAGRRVLLTIEHVATTEYEGTYPLDLSQARWDAYFYTDEPMVRTQGLRVVNTALAWAKAESKQAPLFADMSPIIKEFEHRDAILKIHTFGNGAKNKECSYYELIKVLSDDIRPIAERNHEGRWTSFGVDVWSQDRKLKAQIMGLRKSDIKDSSGDRTQPAIGDAIMQGNSSGITTSNGMIQRYNSSESTLQTS